VSVSEQAAEIRGRLAHQAKDTVRHRICRLLIRFVPYGVDHYVMCQCGSSWNPATIQRLTDQEIVDRFEALTLPEDHSQKLVWKVDGKRKFLTLVPVWKQGEPSGL
jgi:hypothetical protein